MTKQILLSLLNCSWQWLLLSGLLWFATSVIFRKGRRSNATVHLLGLLSLLSLPILFGLNQFVPAVSIDRNPVSEFAQGQPIDVSGLAALTTDVPAISSPESDTQSNNQLLAGGKSFVDWARTDLLLCVWAIGAFAMLIRFVFGLCRIYQLRRRAVAADDSYQAIGRRLARQLNINRPVTVCFSERIASPISFGWLSPYILIPRKLDLEQFELVAAHELAHVQRLDWLTNLFSHVVGVIFFFHPIYHLLNRQLVHLRERICDDWVIQLTGARKNYAQCLLDLVRHGDRGISLALSLNQPSRLESRIDSILKSDRRLDLQLKPRLQLIVATLLFTCLPLLAMGTQLVPLKTFQVSLFAQTESSESEPPTATPSDEPEEADKQETDEQKTTDEKPSKNEEAEPSDEQAEGEQKAADEKPSKNEETEKHPGVKAKKYVIIQEINKEPGQDSDWMEGGWVELYNTSDTEINLKGWTISAVKWDSEDETIQFDEDLKIPAGSYLLLFGDNTKDPAADFLILDTDHFITVDVKEPPDGFYLVLEPESLEKLRITLAEDPLRLTGKMELVQVMEKDSERKMGQKRSLEEALKQMIENVESLQRLLTEKDGDRKREKELSPEEIITQMQEDVALLQRLLKEINEDTDTLKKDGVHKPAQERLKAVKEEAAQLQKRLKQVEEVYKRLPSPEGQIKQIQEAEKRLKQLRDVLEMLKKGEITLKEARERLERLEEALPQSSDR